jgi:hypothetical protein
MLTSAVDQPYWQAIDGVLPARASEFFNHHPGTLFAEFFWVGKMRALILAFVGSIALTASTQAAPLAPRPAALELGTAPPVELAAQGCGWGWRRARWHDQWGNWHWGDCVPDQGASRGWDAGSYYPYAGWRVSPPR